MLNRKRFSPYKVLLIALLSIPCLPHSTELSLNSDWLPGLEGNWAGEAVHTPVGPAPYDIKFTRDDAGCVSGTADTGFSNHSWRFCPAGDGVKLDFLSDFRGNRDTILLEPVRMEQGKVVFKSAEITFMDVVLARADDHITIDIMHHGKLHVRIELTPVDPRSTH